MKLNFFILFSLMIASFISCRKQSSIENTQKSLETDNQYILNRSITQAKSLFADLSAKRTLNLNNKRISWFSTPFWEGAYISSKDENKVSLIVPLKYKHNINVKNNNDNQTLESSSYMSITIGKINSIEVITIIPGKYLINNSLKISDLLIKEDIGGNVIDRYAFKDNKLYKFSNSSTIKQSAINSSYSGECLKIHWYICDRVDGVMINCEYLYTEEVGICNQTLEPPGEGGSVEIEDPFANIETPGTIISENVTNIDSTTKFKDPRWIIVTNKTYHFISQEKGKVKLIDPLMNVWQWEYLNHDKIEFYGYAVGGTVTHSNGTGTPSFTPGTSNVYYGGMSVTFPITFTPNAYNIPVIGPLLAPPITKSYTSARLFNAKP